MRVTGAAFLCFLVLVAAPDLRAGSRPKPTLEIISSLGPRKRVKLYSGESLTFRARVKQDGFGSLFGADEYLHGVTFTLRQWPKVEQDAMAMVKGSNRGVVREVKPRRELWGDPPSSIRIADGSPGRYRLEAEKPGFQSATILIHHASFEIVDIDAELTEREYTASFAVRLIDPDEDGHGIPLRVESLTAEGQVVDVREDLLLAPVVGREDEYRSSRTIRLSSSEVEGFRERLARAPRDPLPTEFADLKAMRIVPAGMIRLSFRTVHAAYTIPLGY